MVHFERTFNPLICCTNITLSIVQENFDINDQDLAHYARAIGHPARIVIISAMLKHEGAIEGEVIEVPQLSKATVIQHLRELKRAGIINGRIFGAKAKYWIEKDKLRHFKQLSENFFQEVK